ncbi:DUF3047 domain-containing protein [Rubrimonas cliftonensis]|uniref:DUF3047 domain-containing protein n=1 Tax=Rubrimonas cliftonensis TaxID=89524 RepID=A0A1H4E8J0_9RHOB|nr:DUF3047 domain-containing protein [Rubrimonas cliftonensis]SEA81147.1 Protein of unknown function [Rubrimonas cliftonensis]
MTRRALMLAAAALAAPALRAEGAWRFLAPPWARAARLAAAGAEIELEADGAVGFLWRPAAARPGDMLRWRWRVDAAPPPTDPAARDADDRPAAVHLWLDAGRGPTLFGRLAEALGQPRVTHALTWQWGGTRPAGTRLANPYHAPSAILVLRGAGEPLGVWREEARDVEADLRAALGVGAASVAALAISADTDDAGGLARARIAGLEIAH